MPEPSEWTKKVTADPSHSTWFVQRFRDLAAAGHDLDGEARLVDAMVGRRSLILDAGCGSGRVGGYLAGRGHEVVGVDVDPVLVAAAQEDHPGPRWVVGDLAELDLPSLGLPGSFDAIVAAGNVMPFLAASTRIEVLRRFWAHLADHGRAVVGFGAGRSYAFDTFFDDVRTAGLEPDLRLAGWDLRAWRPDSDFLVTVLRRA